MSVKMMERNLITKIIIGIVMIAMIAVNQAGADNVFDSSYQLNGSSAWNKVSCTNTTKICAQTGPKIVQGVRVQPKCWRYAFVKTCPYPSKNNCSLYNHCYFVADRQCLAFNSLGNCINMQREFSCKSWNPVCKEDRKYRMDFEEKDGPEKIVCKGIPCIDGNCVDKSYLTDGDMMDSLSKLYTAAATKGADPNNVKFFAGNHRKCTKFPWTYLNCCKEKGSGWGSHLAAKCSTDELELAKKRADNLCKFVGTTSKNLVAGEKSKTLHYCCFKNILDKVVQVEGRKQLPHRSTFGTGKHPDCEGFTIAEIRQIDWSKVDFSEFINDIRGSIFKNAKSVKEDTLKNYAKDLFDGNSFQEANDNQYDSENNYSGWNKGHKTPEQLAREEQEKQDRGQEEERDKVRQAESHKFEDLRLKEAESTARDHQAETAKANGESYSNQPQAAPAISPNQTNYKNKRKKFWYRQ